MDMFGSCVESFLGPNKSVKFVVDDDSAEAVNCPAELLRLLHFSHPVSQVVHSALQSFHVKHGQGTTTFLAMTWFWYKAFQDARTQGIFLCDVIDKVKEIVEDCIRYVEKHSFRLEDYLNLSGCRLRRSLPLHAPSVNQVKSPLVLHCDQKIPSTNNMNRQTVGRSEKLTSGTSLQNTNVSVRKILLRSRHFQSSSDEIDDVDVATVSDISPQMNIPSAPARIMTQTVNPDVLKHLTLLVQRICHGDEERSALVFQAWSNQIHTRLSDGDLAHLYRFDIEKLHIVSILSSPSKSTVISGLLLPVSKAMLQLVAESSSPYRALMLNCDLKFDYHHLGFKTSVKSTVVNLAVSDLFSPSQKELWRKKTLHLMNTLGVDVLLVRGTVDPSIVDSCLSAKIIIMENVGVRILNCLSSASSVPLATYIENCDESNVLSGIHLTPWKLDDGVKDNELEHYAVLQVHSMLQTVVLCALCHPLSYLQEHRIWHTFRRLASVASDSGKMVAGGGKTEMCVVQRLKEIPETSVEMKWAIDLTASVFLKFKQAVERNCSLGGSSVQKSSHSTDSITDLEVVDCRFSKIEAWRSSLVVSYLIANTQFAVYVGDQGTLPVRVHLQSCLEDL